jgi:hypothetical protein
MEMASPSNGQNTFSFNEIVKKTALTSSSNPLTQDGLNQVYNGMLFTFGI